MASRLGSEAPQDPDDMGSSDPAAGLRALVAQLEPLLDEAELVLDGDAAAAARWRLLLAWRPADGDEEQPVLTDASPANASLSSEGVTRLWAATAAAAETTEQLEAMSHRLVELLGPVAALAQLQQADPPVMRTMAAIGMPGLPGGGLPGVSTGLDHRLPGVSTGLDHRVPGEGPPLGDVVWPGGRRKPVGGGGDPIDVDSAREFWERLFRPGQLDPRVPCGVLEVVAMMRIQKDAGDYAITSLQPADACAGDQVTLTGSGFLPGRPTTVVFASAVAATAPYTVAAAPTSITATEIKVLVPAGATAGPVRVRTELGTVRPCGRDRTVVQRGNDVAFVGGTPAITALTVDGRDSDAFVDGPTAKVAWTLVLPAPASPLLGTLGPGTPVTITVTNPSGATTYSQSHSWPRVRSAVVPIPSAPQWVDVAAEYATACGHARRSVRVWVGAAGRVEVVAVEVTQGIQRLLKAGEGWDTADRSDWNSLELIAGKPTVVRAYPVVRYPAGATNLRPYVLSARLEMREPATGTRVGPTLDALQLGADQLLHAGVALTVGAALPDRRRTNQSFNFHVPAGYAVGDLDLKVVVTVAQGPSPGAVVTRTQRAHWRAKSSLNVHYVRVFGKGGGPTPLSDQEARQVVAAGLELLPFPVLRLAPSPYAVLGNDEVWTAKDGNSRLLDEIEEISEDYDDTRYMGVVNTPVPVNGLSGTTATCETSAWASKEPIVIAHEFSHMFCFGDLSQPQPVIANIPFDIPRMTTLNDLAGRDDLTDYMGARGASATVGGAPVRPIAISEASWTGLASNNSPW